MREGEIRTCGCNCGQPLPHGSSPSRQYIDSLHAKRAERQRAASAWGLPRGRDLPPPHPGGAPPTTCHSTPQRTADVSVSGVNGKRRPPPEPEPPADPLPINDPTAILRRRLLAEAEALLALPHVEAVTISVRAGTVTSLRSTWDVQDCGDHYEAAQVHTAGVYGERHGYHANQGADLDFGGAP